MPVSQFSVNENLVTFSSNSEQLIKGQGYKLGYSTGLILRVKADGRQC